MGVTAFRLLVDMHWLLHNVLVRAGLVQAKLIDKDVHHELIKVHNISDRFREHKLYSTVELHELR